MNASEGGRTGDVTLNETINVLFAQIVMSKVKEKLEKYPVHLVT